ncbi:MAG: hypothetical protein U0936_11135 [Planctomycetaceae bacterium]
MFSTIGVLIVWLWLVVTTQLVLLAPTGMLVYSATSFGAVNALLLDLHWLA